MRPKPTGRFTLREVELEKRIGRQQFKYRTFLLAGWLRGKRVRKQVASREEALGEKAALEVEAANVDGEIRARITRLSAGQLAEAETAFGRLGPNSLSLAVEHFLATYPSTQATEMLFDLLPEITVLR